MSQDELDLRQYLFNYYGNFLTAEELEYWQQIIKNSKNKNRISFIKLKSKRDKELFYSKTVKRLLEDHKNEIFLNKCSICGVLARTPQSKICRNGHKKINGEWVVAPAVP